MDQQDLIEVRDLIKEIKGDVKELTRWVVGEAPNKDGLATRMAAVEQSVTGMKKFLWTMVGTLGTGTLGFLGKALDLV
jgi:hypothetical protein